jgi:lipopolysaccharide cholinephosphotransferase
VAQAGLSLEELRGVQLAVLAEFDRLCRRHDLTYYAAYGTLLGAVRHGGYIPWDDDIDVMMPRAEYDRLPGVFASANPAHLTLGCSTTRTDWPFPYAKVGDDRTELTEPLADPLPLGVNLDVFPLDLVPSNRVVRAVQSRLLQLLRWAVELRYIAADRGRAWHHPVAIIAIKPLLRLVPAQTLVSVFTAVARIGSARGTEVGVRVGSYDWWVPSGDLGSPTELSFEGLRVLSPADSQTVLTAMYGNYTELPPEAERVSQHGFTAAWRDHPAEDPTGGRTR